MASQSNPFISNERSENVPTSIIDKSYIKTFFELLSEINQKAAEKQVASLTKEGGSSDEEFENFKIKVRDLFVLSLLIYGSKGEFILCENTEILDKPTFPQAIDRIFITNTVRFQNQFKQDPLHVIKVNFDFTKPSVFDWDQKPSHPTQNLSSFKLESSDEQWIEWATSKIKNSLQTKRTRVGWMHRSHIYDISMWFIIIPITFWNLYKLQVRYDSFFKSTNPVLATALYLYIFLLVMYLYMLLFNYLRWAFPYVEYTGNTQSQSKIHKAVIVFTLLAVLGNFAYEIAKYLIPKIF